ncbi:MAG: hypothetical protein AAB422_07505, partial [Planctomycetota bacterium]
TDFIFLATVRVVPVMAGSQSPASPFLRKTSKITLSKQVKPVASRALLNTGRAVMIFICVICGSSSFFQNLTHW